MKKSNSLEQHKGRQPRGGSVGRIADPIAATAKDVKLCLPRNRQGTFAFWASIRSHMCQK